MEFLPHEKGEAPEIEVPRLPFKQFVFFPGLVAPIILDKKKVIKIFGDTFPCSSYIFVTPYPFLFEKNKSSEEQGTLCKILNWRKLSCGRLKIFLQGIVRASFLHRESEYCVRVKKLNASVEVSSSKEVSFLEKEVLSSLKVLHSLGKILSPDLLLLEEQRVLENEGKFVHHFFSNLLEQQDLLELKDGSLKLRRIHRKIEEEILERRQKKWLNTPKLKEKILKGV